MTFSGERMILNDVNGLDLSQEFAMGGSIALIMGIFAFAFLFGILMVDIIIPYVLTKIVTWLGWA